MRIAKAEQMPLVRGDYSSHELGMQLLLNVHTRVELG